jgi:hypothetical protein
MLLLCIAVFLLVLSLTYKQNFSIFEGLIIRFAGSFDGIYYFSHFDLYSSFQYNPLDFIYNLVNPFLGFFRISEYKYTIGELILEKATGFPLSGFGPNATFVLESLIYFSPFFSWLYCLLVGYSVSFVRTFFILKVLKNPTQLNLVIYIVCSIFILRLPVDSNTISLALLNVIVFVLPVFIISGVLNGSHINKIYLKHSSKNLP